MPTILLCLNGKVVHQIQGFDELGGTEEFSTQLLAWVLSQHNVLTYDGDMPEEYFKGKGVNSVHVAMINGKYGGSEVKACESRSDELRKAYSRDINFLRHKIVLDQSLRSSQNIREGGNSYKEYGADSDDEY